jgi:TPR repeat protein
MASVRELIEVGRPPLENERALVVVDEPTEPELELSFYDYQQSRYVAPNGLTNEPHFFCATLVQMGGKQGYVVGAEVTRSLRHRALVGVGSRKGPLGDVTSSVRAYRPIKRGANIDIPASETENVAQHLVAADEARSVAAVGATASESSGVAGDERKLPPQPSELERPLEKKVQRRRSVTWTALLVILLIVSAPFALARLEWYGLAIDVKGSLDFTVTPRQQGSEATFTPEYTRVEIRRALWLKAFEGWWINERPSARIELDSNGWWLSKDEQLADRAIIIVLRPNAAAKLSSSVGVLRSQLAFRNTQTGQVFASREATLRPLVGHLTIQSSDPIVFTAFKGGPFNPEAAQIILSAGGADIRWSVQDIPSWLALRSGPTGNLNKDASVTMTVAPQPGDLAPGSYQAGLTFRADESNTVAQKPVRLIVLDAQLECDKRAASRFDPDRPSTAPFIVDEGGLSDDDLDQATRACAAAFQGDTSAASRRFISEMGRVYAARAVRLAKSRADTAARAAMSNAVRLWQEAADKGSTTAMSFLGSYWAGLYDDQIDPSPSKKCLGASNSFSFASADMRMARDFWERAAKAKPPNAEAMFHYGRLLVLAPDFCPPRSDLQNIPEGVSWLKQATDRGNIDAAEVLGQLFYRGRTPSSSTPGDSFAKNVDEGLRWLTMACKEGNLLAKEFVASMISTAAMQSAKRPAGC